MQQSPERSKFDGKDMTSISQTGSSLDVPKARPHLIAPSPGRVKGLDGKTHAMTEDEMKERFLDEDEGKKGELLDLYNNKNINTQAAWSNREDDCYFSGKRLLFASKAEDITEKWIKKLNGLTTEEIE